MNCRKCGTGLEPDAIMCPICGQAVHPSLKIPIAAAVLIMILVFGLILLLSEGGK